MSERRDPLELLQPVERLGWRLADSMARRHRRFSTVWSVGVVTTAARLLLGRRIRVRGLEHVADVGPEDRVVLVANHRSFYDFFLIGAIATTRTPLPHRQFYPVRANFFYTNPLGILLNLGIAGMIMFPPLLRDRGRARFNHFALDRVAEELAVPGTLVGLHPEGTRNQGPDPYAFLKPRPGVGRVILGAPAGVRVFPVFSLGLTNRLHHEVAENVVRPERHPIHVLFGPELDFDDLRAEGSKPATQRRASERCLSAIGRLGEAERRWRSEDGLD